MANLSERVTEALNHFYDRVFIEQAEMSARASDFKVALPIILTSEMLFGKVIGYRKVRVPRYLTMKLPVISREYDDDPEYGDGSFRGLLLSVEEVKLFRIGTRIVKMPIYERPKGKIAFRRYKKLEAHGKSAAKSR